MSDAVEVDISQLDTAQRANLTGALHQHLKALEQWFAVTCAQQENQIRVSGSKDHVQQAGACLAKLSQLAREQELSVSDVQELLQVYRNGEDPDSFRNVLQLRKLRVMPKSSHQDKYLEKIERYDINFGVGPAGTGKTYLAVAKAVQALEQETVNRLVLTRPAIEAGEKLGFLPGDIAQKVDPYLRPVYDALYEMIGFERVEKLLSRHVIEVAPLAYMRGRTLNHAFIILDEAQNTTPQQMKMFLTRVGFGSKAVITGDVTQTDLPGNQLSGLIEVLNILKKVKGIGVSHFTADDVVRHPLVQRIVRAYEDHEKKHGE